MKRLKIRNIILYTACVLVTAVVLTLTIWGPQWLADYRDRQTLDKMVQTDSVAAQSAYRYELNVNECVYLLSKALESQTTAQSGYSMQTDVAANSLNSMELTGTYALVESSQAAAEGELTEDEIYDVCSEQLQELRDCGVLPDDIKEVAAEDYDAVLYSAIDVLEPSNNISVWKLTLSTSRQTTHKVQRAIDVYLDAETGKIYEFYVRCRKSTDWESLDPDSIVSNWAAYLELSGLQTYPSDSTLLENTQYYQKYLFTGFEDTQTVVTVGFYDGINELFVKVE